MREELEQYDVNADGVPAKVIIYRKDEENVPIYDLKIPEIEIGTKALIKDLAEEISEEIPVSIEEITDPRKMKELRGKFHSLAKEKLKQKFPHMSKEKVGVLAGMLLHSTYGLGKIEIILADPWLEEIAINNSQAPISVFHKKHGWLKTNHNMTTEEEIYNFAAQIGRKVGRQITSLNPIMDAHLLTGDRVAATLFPISTAGNTITIRKFARNPWTVVHLIENGTVSKEIIAFLWLAMEYELNIMIAGGTASGKTSFLNSLSALIPPKHRIISIEDTREIALPKQLEWNWIPLNSRDKNPEGQGEVTMLDLMIASLRMRPDRIIVGEVRRREQAETMFEAMHTGHSVYTTVHADNVEQTKRRLTEPPIQIPKSEIEALHLVVVQSRDRRKNIRRTMEVAEILRGNAEVLETNSLFRWRAKSDTFEKANNSIRVFEELNLHTGLTPEELEVILNKKETILKWLIDQQIKDIDQIGKIIEIYYRDPERIIQAAQQNLAKTEFFKNEK